MKKKILSASFIIFSIFYFSFVQAAEEAWNIRMQKLLDAFRSIAPYVYSSKAFYEPDNKQKILLEIKNFEKLSHNVQSGAMKSVQTKDPSLKFISSRLEDDIAEARQAFENDNKDYAKYKLKKVTKNCFQCHSRFAQGPEFSKLELPIDESKLKNTELADIYVATRQFDKALEVLEKSFDETLAQKDPSEFQRSVRNFLALAVRVKQDPELANSVVDKTLRFPATPPYLKEDAREWKKDIAKWKMEAKLTHNSSSQYRMAVALVNEAKEVQEYPLDNRSDVLYLRASSLFHQFLETAKDKNKIASALYYLGHSYEVLDDIGQWYLHDIYFESCIRALPNSAIARKCYHRYEMNIFLGYSGSGGIYVPENERSRLQELFKIATGETSKKNK